MRLARVFAGCALLMKLLRETPGVAPVMARDGWPKDPKTFENAKAVVFYMDGGGGHPIIQDHHLDTLEKAGWDVKDVDLFEVNEAFACVAMIAMHDLGIPHDRINVHGGATALGHPIGASGARILMTLVNELHRRGGGLGVAAICSGGGQGDAVIVEVNGG